MFNPFNNKLSTVLMSLAAALWMIYQLIYPFINPSNLRLQDAAVQILLFLLSYIGIGHASVMHDLKKRI